MLKFYLWTTWEECKYSQSCALLHMCHAAENTNSATPTLQGADELVNVLHIPFGGVTGQEGLVEERELVVVVVPLPVLWAPVINGGPLGPWTGGGQRWGGLLIAGHVRTLTGLPLTAATQVWRRASAGHVLLGVGGWLSTGAHVSMCANYSCITIIPLCSRTTALQVYQCANFSLDGPVIWMNASRLGRRVRSPVFWPQVLCWRTFAFSVFPL